MKRKLFIYSFAFIVALLTFSCVDDKFDDEDQTTDTETKFDDLVLPIDLDKLTLERILDYNADDDGSLLSVYKSSDGNEYFAINRTGVINSKSVEIEKISFPHAKGLTPIVKELVANSNQTFLINDLKSNFVYSADNVNTGIVNVSKMEISAERPMKINLQFSVSSETSLNVPFSLNNLIVSLPVGMHGSYGNVTSSSKGLINLGNLTSGTDGHVTAEIVVDEIDFNLMAGGNITNQNGTFFFTGKIGINYAQLKLSETNEETCVMTSQITMSGFEISALSGNINYPLNNFEMTSINLSGIPSFLDYAETSLTLVNPQLYLSVNNEPADYGLYVITGMTVTPVREGNNRGEGIALSDFIIGKNSSSGYNNLIIAPDPFSPSLSNVYSSLNPVRFVNFSHILTGDGIPESLTLSFDHPYLSGKTDKLPLGKTMSLNGNYRFFTPLELADGSVIKYVRERKDWFGDDVKDVTVTKLNVEAYATSELPIEIILTAYPLVNDKKTGGVVKDASNPASFTLRANAGSQRITLKFEKEIEGLNGMVFECYGIVKDVEILSPSQYIKLDNIKATVTGHYTK